MSIHIYVEGGGDQRETLAACRAGFSELFKKVAPVRKPKIIACGGRRQAYDKFCTALGQSGGNVCILLVDSEGEAFEAVEKTVPTVVDKVDSEAEAPVAVEKKAVVNNDDNIYWETRNWEYLKNRDGWDCPEGATEGHVYLMVQFMESWFLADREALKEFYGQGFNVNALPKQPIEQISKNAVENALNAAIRNTKTKKSYKLEYHKTEHGFKILAHLDPEKVGQASSHAKRLFTFLSK